MINTQFSISNVSQRPNAACGSCPSHQDEPAPAESFSPGHPGATCRFPTAIPEPVMGFEPWQMGEPTSDPAVGPQFADKLVRTFGEQALLSIDDPRIKNAEGYHFQGWEMPQSPDFLTSRTLASLGEGWEAAADGSYELKSKGVGQSIRFDAMNQQVVLESYYEENRYDTTRFSEILKRDQDGSMRRETPPAGL